MSGSTNISILIVDDEEFFRDRLARAFAGRGYCVFPAADYDEAIQIINENKPTLAVVDLKMPGKSGLDLLKTAGEIHPAMKTIVLTGYGSIATATEAVKLGAFSYLPKPADVDDILSAFSRDPNLEVESPQDDFEPPSLARMEWEHINRVLTDCNGNISLAAKKLSLHRRTLQRKLYKYAPK